MTDSRYNTFYMVWNKNLPNEKELLEFRTLAAINLANPPPGNFLNNVKSSIFEF